MLRSAPVAKDRRVLAQSSNKRIVPAMSAATANAMVSGNGSCAGIVSPSARMKGCAAACSKTRSGAVNTARNGNTAPILRISANEANSISTSSSPNCPRRRGLMWCQRRCRSCVMDWLVCTRDTLHKSRLSCFTARNSLIDIKP